MPSGRRSESVGEETEQHDSLTSRLRRSIDGNPAFWKNFTRGDKRPAVTDRSLLAAVGQGDGTQLLANVEVCSAAQPVQVTAEEIVDYFEGFHSEGLFTIALSSACQESTVVPPRLKDGVFVAAPSLMGKMMSTATNARSRGLSENAAFKAAYDAVSKRKEAENMLKSSVAVFPLLLSEEGYLSWVVVIAFQLKKVEEALRGGDKTQMVLCAGYSEGQETWERFGPVTELLTMFVREKYVAESGTEVNLPYEPDRRIVIMHTTWAKDADYGALMVRFVEMAISNPINFPDIWSENEYLVRIKTSWETCTFGEKMKWYRPIVCIRDKTTNAVLKAIRTNFERRRRDSSTGTPLSTGGSSAPLQGSRKRGSGDISGGREGASGSRAATSSPARARPRQTPKNKDRVAPRGGGDRASINAGGACSAPGVDDSEHPPASQRENDQHQHLGMEEEEDEIDVGESGSLGATSSSASARLRQTPNNRGRVAPMGGGDRASINAGGASSAPGVDDALHPPASQGEGDEHQDLVREDEEDEIEAAQNEWDASGVFGDGGFMPEGELSPDESLEEAASAVDGNEPFTRAGVREFVTEGLGMGPEWRGDIEGVKQSFRPTRKLDLELSSVDVESDGRQLVMSVDLDALRMTCELPSLASTITSTAAILLCKCPVLATGMIRGGMFSFPIAGESRNVKAQNVPNIRIGILRGDHRLGDIAVNLLFMCSYYELDESERARDVFRAASKKQIGAYLEALSATLKSLQEHPDLIHLNSGVAATVDNLRLAQRDEVLAMPLQREARNTFFETLQAELELAFDIEGGEEEEGRPAFLVVLKGIGQKNMMRKSVFQAGEAEKELELLREWERQRDIAEDSGGHVAHPEPQMELATSRVAEFASALDDALGTIVDVEAAPSSLSIDIGLEVQASTPEDEQRLVLIPNIGWWGGDGRGASCRSSPDPYNRGRMGDTRMSAIDRYSCLGLDQGGSLSGRTNGDGCPVMRSTVNEQGDTEYIDSGTKRLAMKVYPPSLYHFDHTAAGPIMANALRTSPVTSLVEMIRIAALGGGRVDPKRFNAVSKKLQDVEATAASALSGLGSRSGSMRVEVSYSLVTGEGFGDMLHCVVTDCLREVLRYDDHGWSSVEGSFFAVPAEDVAFLAKAGFDRCFAAIKVGLDRDGQSVCEALPIGLLPSVGEAILQLGGKVFRRAVVGRMLLEGLHRFGYVGLLDEGFENLSRPGGDSSSSSSLPPGLLIGYGGGRSKEGYSPGVRRFLKEFGPRLPRIGGSDQLLANDGKELFTLLRKVVDLLLQEIQRLLRRNKMLPEPDDNPDALWRPDVRGLREANEALDSSPDSSSRRYSVDGTNPTPAGVHLRRMVKPMVNRAVDRLPSPAATVFSSIVNVLSGKAMDVEAVTRWGEVLLESVYSDDQGLVLVPETHATRMFRTIGRFVKCNDANAEQTLQNFKEEHDPGLVLGGLGDLTGQLLKCFCEVYSSPDEYAFTPVACSRSVARVSGTRFGSQGRRSADVRNPWRKVHLRDANANISNPVVLLALVVGVNVGSSILRVYGSRERSDVTGRQDSSKKAYNRLDAAVETLGHISFEGEGLEGMNPTTLYEHAHRLASAVSKPSVRNIRPQMALSDIPGKYGMTTGQLLAAACAVMRGGSRPSADANVVQVVKDRIETEDGSAAASAFFEATKDPMATLTASIYPRFKGPKTPQAVFDGWCRLRGDSVERGGSGQKRLRDERAARRSQDAESVMFSNSPCPSEGVRESGDEENADNGQDGFEPDDGESEVYGDSFESVGDDMAGSSLPSRQQSFGASFGSFDPSQDDLGGSSVPHQPQRLEAGLGSFDTTQADGVFDNGVQGSGGGAAGPAADGVCGAGSNDIELCEGVIIHNPGPEALGDDLLGFGGEDDRRTRRTKRGGQREVGDLCSGTNAAMGQRNAESSGHAEEHRMEEVEGSSILEDEDEMLSIFESPPDGQRGILRDNVRVKDVVSSFRDKGSDWLEELSAQGLSGSHLTKQVARLKCTERRPNSIVKDVEVLKAQFLEDGDKSCTPTGSAIIVRLMQILVRASILTGPDNKSRYRTGNRLLG